MTTDSGIISRYGTRLPLTAETPIVSLCEGGTPLVPLQRLAAQLKIDCALYAKYEGLNPTGSFKDRGMTVAVSHALGQGCHTVICASTGNTSASAAAYAARAGLRAIVLIPEGKIARGKLAQALFHGATVLQIQGNFDDGMALVKQLGEEAGLAIVNSINPYRLQGQKTIAFEVVDALTRAPDYHCLPVGNAGNISAHWIGYQDYLNDGVISAVPKLLGYQAAGSAPFILGKPVAEPDTVATAIRIGQPQSWDKAWQAQRESGGWFAACTDDAILAAQRLLAEQEGLFCEPASAVSVAGFIADWQAGKIKNGSVVVFTLTGHGLKDSDIALSQNDTIITVDAELQALRDVLQGT